MPSSAASQSKSAAPHSSAAATKHIHPDIADSSDAETEPLPYDEDDDDQDAPADDVMDLDQLAQHAAASAALPTDQDAPGEPADVSMDPSNDSQLEPSQAEDLADLPASQLTATHDPNSNMSSPQKTGGFTGDEFSDESELTDEDDEQNQDEDASSLSDDDLGGSDDEDEDDDEEEQEDEDQDDDDAGSKTHEDEAAEALAALTGGADDENDDAGAAAGLDALAALATAGDADDDQDDQDDDEVSDPEDGETATASAAAGGAAKPVRVSLLRQSGGDDDGLSSDITPEPEDADADAAADDASDHPGSPRDTDLDLIASMKKRAAATGGATSLLEPEQLVDSLPGSASSSRAASPLADEDDDAEKPELAEDADAETESKHAQADQADAEHPDTAAGTPAPDVAEQDDDTSTDEAAIRRQEAMEALTKIEIGFAMLRDRLYVERLQEISKEGDMILEGTHPELLHLTKAIETRRERRTELVDLWFEHQEKQYERVAKAEEFAAWSIWRSSCAGLRRDMMDEYSRKRRRLDREKRTLDAPRPARRHQIFETELVRNPDRLHIPLTSSSLPEDAEPTRASGSKLGRKQSAKRKALAREIEAGDEFVAYPDLKGLAEADVMMDIEQMGIRPAGMPPGLYDPFYGAPVGLEFQNPEVYAMYGPEAAAAAAAAAAQAHMNGVPYNLPPGARGLPPPPPGAMMAPGTPGSIHTPHRHGHALPPPPPGHMHPGMDLGMMAFDPYAAAEMEHAARMRHREQQARMGIDLNDPHHRSSPFPPDMYQPYPPHFNMPPGAGGPGPGMRPGMSNMPPSPTPPHRTSSGGGRKERASMEDGVHVSGRGRGAAKTPGRSKQPRSSQPRDGHVAGGGIVESPTQTKSSGGGKTNLPPPPSMPVGAVGAMDERDHKVVSNGAGRGPPGHHARHPNAPQTGSGFGGVRRGPSPGPNAGLKGHGGPPPAATPVAAAAAAGVGNRSLYPSE